MPGHTERDLETATEAGLTTSGGYRSRTPIAWVGSTLHVSSTSVGRSLPRGRVAAIRDAQRPPDTQTLERKNVASMLTNKVP
jgi:hypothetical protein